MLLLKKKELYVENILSDKAYDTVQKAAMDDAIEDKLMRLMNKREARDAVIEDMIRRGKFYD